MLQVTRVSSKSIKVKIPKPCLHSALQSSDSSSDLVYVWKNHVPRLATTTPSTSSSLRQTDTIQIATWNCRGLHNSVPYIKHLISKGTDIVVRRNTGSGLSSWTSWSPLTPIIHTLRFAIIASPPRQHLDVVVEAVQSCGRKPFLPPLCPIWSLTGSVASNFPLRARTQHSPFSVSTCLALISLKRFTMHILPPLTKPLPRFPPLPHYSLSVISIVI